MNDDESGFATEGTVSRLQVVRCQCQAAGGWCRNDATQEDGWCDECRDSDAWPGGAE